MEEVRHIASGVDIAHIIQLAIAPVFMVAAIAGLLGVLSGRLGRVIDRARAIEMRVPLARDDQRHELLVKEAGLLWSRIRLINWAIRLCASGALMICLVVVTLFVGQFVSSNISLVIAALFVLAMLAVVVGLILMLIEIGIAAKRMQQGMEVSLQGIQDD